MAINGCETGAFAASDAGTFLESPFHARDMNDAGLSSNFAFLSYTPDMGSPGDAFYGTDPIGCNACLIAERNMDDPNAPYKSSKFMALENGGQGPIDFYGGATAPPIFSPSGLGGWMLLDFLQYNGFPAGGPPPEPWPAPPLGIYVAGWGAGFTAKLNRLMQPGKYSGSGGFYYSNQGGGGGYTHPSLDGSVSLQIVSADGAQIIDVTPPNCGSTAQGYHVPLTFDSVALFGRRIPFFPQVTMTGVSNPWINGDYPAQPFLFGPCFQATLQPD